jgi:ubiquinone/menaquinone biosynthesis C-methylase UbiE
MGHMDYVMGRTDHETRRLMLQGEIYRPHSRHLFTLAGIRPGMRVLDVGCGAGDVSLLIAELVGPTGSVIGVDADPVVLEVARERARGLPNVEFAPALLPEVALDGPVDALVGRLILIHLPDPVQAVRVLSRHVRPGGVVTFQDFDLQTVRTVPPTPLVAGILDRMAEAMRVAGADPESGERLYRIFRQAGLDGAGIAGTTPAGNADSVVVPYAAATVASLAPLLEKLGLATTAELDPDTLLDRMRSELAAADAVLYAPELTAVWARV